MGQKTTILATTPQVYRPLAVEYIPRTGQRKREDGTWIWFAPQQVSLFYPERPGLYEAARLANLSPQAALALLTWLMEEKPTLEQLVKEEEEQVGV